MRHALLPVIMAAYAGLFVLGVTEDWREAVGDALGLDDMLLILYGALILWLPMLANPVGCAEAHAAINSRLHMVGRVISVILLALMVCFILGQVFFRYVLNAAPNWTEEAARFGMLWMTGLMAPIAFRFGGFVAIDMLPRALGRIPAGVLNLILFLISLSVLVVCWDKGLNNHVDTMSGRGDSSSLRLPLNLVGGEQIKFQNNWQYASLFVGVTLLIMVNIELILRLVASLTGREMPDLDGDVARAD